MAAYVFGATFDLISVIGGDDDPWARDFWRAGTYTFIAGAGVSVLAALTGFWDWFRSSKPGTQARRTINTHAWIMVSVTVLALVDIAWRLRGYDTEPSTPGGVLALSIVVAALVSWGSVYGGALVYDYGFNVETSGDHPVWHPAETDVFPGQHD